MGFHDVKNQSGRRLRFAGRIGLAILGGGLFALLGWDPRPAPRESREHPDPAAADPDRTAEPASDAAHESNTTAFDAPLAIVPHSATRSVATISPNTRTERHPRRRAGGKTRDGIPMTNGTEKGFSVQHRAVENGSRINHSQNPRAPP